MRSFANNITLVKNSRGVYGLDTSKGCSSGVEQNKNGCYGDCYAARYSKRRGFDFGETVLRSFENYNHEQNIKKQINNIDMPFIRFGVTGDPSENWEHTIKTIEEITRVYQLSLFKEKKKEIVIITKHWNTLTNDQLERLSELNVCVNTSVSALDKPDLLNLRLNQYNKLKFYCRSVLRVVSCNFNLINETGKRLNKIQDKLFNNKYVLDNILRVGKNNELVTSRIINIEKTIFLNNTCYISKHNKNTYIGKCSKCPDMCGLSLFNN